MKSFTTLTSRLKEAYATLRKSKAPVVPLLLEDIVTNIDRMTLHAKLLSMSYDLAGCKTFYPKKDRLNTPEIELCDIIHLSQCLNRERNQELFSGCVYVNVCEDGKFYVGYTKIDCTYDIMLAAKQRLHEHRDNGGGTYWTYYYPVISCMFVFPGDEADEDLMTILLSKCVGVSKVRGGQWASALIIPSLPEMSAQEAISRLVSRNQ